MFENAFPLFTFSNVTDNKQYFAFTGWNNAGFLMFDLIFVIRLYSGYSIQLKNNLERSLSADIWLEITV